MSIQRTLPPKYDCLKIASGRTGTLTAKLFDSRKLVREPSRTPTFQGIKAIFLDLDGTISNSMPYHYLAWTEVLRKRGASSGIGPLEFFMMEGSKMREVQQFICERAGLTLNEEQGVAMLKQHGKIFRNIFTPGYIAGAHEFILEMKGAGYPLGVVTGGTRDMVDRFSPKGMLRLMDVTITGDDVKNAKPDPEPYLSAMRAISPAGDLHPEECVVIENAPLGIISAKVAGMFCIAIATTLPPGLLEDADRIVERFQIISSLIK